MNPSRRGFHSQYSFDEGLANFDDFNVLELMRDRHAGAWRELPIPLRRHFNQTIVQNDRQTADKIIRNLTYVFS